MAQHKELKNEGEAPSIKNTLGVSWYCQKSSEPQNMSNTNHGTEFSWGVQPMGCLYILCACVKPGMNPIDLSQQSPGLLPDNVPIPIYAFLLPIPSWQEKVFQISH